MSSIVFLVEQFAIGIYIFLGILAVWTFRGLMIARREFRATNFELERGMARYQIANAITYLILLIEAVLIIFGVQSVVAPEIRAQLAEENELVIVPEDLPFNTPTPQMQSDTQIDPSDVESRLEPTEIALLVTPTLTPTPVGTILPNTAPPIGCDTENATLQVPANGMVVFEPIEVIGSANAENFAYYRFELRGESTFNSFAVLQEVPQPASELGALGQFVPSFYEPGEYQFQLTVFDITNTVKASCTVNIFISPPIPTPTPLAAAS